MLDPAAPALLVRTGDKSRVRIPVLARRSPHRLRFRTSDGDRPVPLELLSIAAVDQSPVVPRFGDQRLKIAHAAASASCAPTEATAARPSSSAAPAARAD